MSRQLHTTRTQSQKTKQNLNRSKGKKKKKQEPVKSHYGELETNKKSGGKKKTSRQSAQEAFDKYSQSSSKKVKSHYGEVDRTTKSKGVTKQEARTSWEEYAQNAVNKPVKSHYGEIESKTHKTSGHAEKPFVNAYRKSVKNAQKNKEKVASSHYGQITQKKIDQSEEQGKKKFGVGTYEGTKSAVKAKGKSDKSYEKLKKKGEKTVQTVTDEQLKTEKDKAADAAAREARFFSNPFVVSGKMTQKEADKYVEDQVEAAKKGVEDSHKLTYSNAPVSTNDFVIRENASKFANTRVEDKEASDKAKREAAFYAHNMVARGKMTQEEADQYIKDAGKGHYTSQGNNILDKLGGKGTAEEVGSQTAGWFNDSKVAAGIVQGLSYGDQKKGLGKYTDQAAELIDTSTQSGAFNAGYGIGIMGQFMLGGVGSMGESLGEGAAKFALRGSEGLLGKAANLTQKNAATKFLTNRAGELAVETPLNFADALKMSTDARGNVDKDALVKYMALNTGMTFGMGGAIEGIGLGVTKSQTKQYEKLYAKALTGDLSEEEMSTMFNLEKKITEASNRIGLAKSRIADKTRYNTIVGEEFLGKQYTPKEVQEILSKDAIHSDRMSYAEALRDNSLKELDDLRNQRTKLLEDPVKNADEIKGVEAKMKTAEEKADLAGRQLDIEIKRNKHTLKDLNKSLSKMEKATGIKYDIMDNSGMLDLARKYSKEKIEDEDFIKGFIYTDESGKTRIAINSESPQAHQTVIGHETGHFLKDVDPEEFNAIGDMVINYAKKIGEYDSLVQDMRKWYPDAKPDELMEELRCELIGRYIYGGNDAFIKQLAGEQPNILKRIINYFKEILGQSVDNDLAKELKAIAERLENATKNLADKAKAQAEAEAKAVAENTDPEYVKSVGAEPRASKVTDKKTLKFLDDQEKAGKTVTVYRAMAQIDGELYPPMATKLKTGVKGGELQPSNKLGEWIKADERPDLITSVDKNGVGKFTLKKSNNKELQGVAYNPYIHTSFSPLNDQFTSAWQRPDLVVVKGIVPESELTSGYKAEFAKDAVGKTEWHSGVVAGKLPEAREVLLSRYFKPQEVLSDADVASSIKGILGDTDIEIPYNVVTPALRAELEKIGVPIGKGVGGAPKDIPTLKTGRASKEKSNARFSKQQVDKTSRLFAPVGKDGMRSKAWEVVANDLKGEKFGAKDLPKMLEGKGVKAEELKWTGLEAFLDGKKSVSKQELQDFFASNTGELKTVKRIDGSLEDETRVSREILAQIDEDSELYQKLYDAELDRARKHAEEFGLPTADIEEAARANVEDFTLDSMHHAGYSDDEIQKMFGVDFTGKETKYENYMLDGAENYREYEYIMEGNEFQSAHWGEEGVVIHSRIGDFNVGVPKDNSKSYDVALSSLSDKANEISTDISRQIDSIIDRNFKQDYNLGNGWELHVSTGKRGSSLHFYLRKQTEPDVYPKPSFVTEHLSLNDLKGNYDTVDNTIERIIKKGNDPIRRETTYDKGGRTLYVDEIQSDLHNKGHKQGYKDAEIEKKSKDAWKKVEEVEEEVDKLNPEIQKLVDEYQKTNNEELFDKARDLTDKQHSLIRKATELRFEARKYHTEGISDAPYKKNYTDYAMKRALREAVENDYEYLAWSTGKIHDERWQGALDYSVEYDTIIPKFMKKYVKQWNGQVEKIRLAENGEEVWAVKITPEMRESVGKRGQYRFSRETRKGLPKVSDVVEDITKDSRFSGDDKEFAKDIDDLASLIRDKKDATGKAEEIRDKYITIDEYETVGEGVDPNVKSILKSAPISLAELGDGSIAHKLENIGLSKDDVPSWLQLRANRQGRRNGKRFSSLDSVYTELSEDRPDLFPPDASHEDKLANIIKAATQEPERARKPQDWIDGEKNDLAIDILDRVAEAVDAEKNIAKPETLTSEAEKQIKQLEKERDSLISRWEDTHYTKPDRRTQNIIDSYNKEIERLKNGGAVKATPKETPKVEPKKTPKAEKPKKKAQKPNKYEEKATDDAHRRAGVSQESVKDMSDKEIGSEIGYLKARLKNGKTKSHNKLREKRLEELTKEAESRKTTLDPERDAYEQMKERGLGNRTSKLDKTKWQDYKSSLPENESAVHDMWTTVRRLFENSHVAFENQAKAVARTNKKLGNDMLAQINNVIVSRNIAAAAVETARTNSKGIPTGKSLNEVFTVKYKGKEIDLRNNEKMRDDLSDYLYLKHSEARSEYGKEIFGDNFTPADAKAAMESLELKYGDGNRAAGRKFLEAFETDVRDYINWLNDFRVDTGLINKEQLAALKEKYPYYVPTYRTGKGVVASYDLPTTSAKIDNGINVATGSDAPIEDLYLQLAKITDKTIKSGHQNKMVAMYAESMGLKPKDVPKEASVEDMAKSQIVAGRENDGTWTVSYYKDGEQVTIPVDKQIAKGLREWNVQDKAAFIKLMSYGAKITKPYKALITDLNLVFGVRNGMRDAQQALVNSKDSRWYAHSIPAATTAVRQKDNAFRLLYDANGGKWSSIAQLNNLDEIAKLNTGGIKGTIQKGIDVIESINGAIEMMPRMCEFIGTIEKEASRILKSQNSSIKELKQAIEEELRKQHPNMEAGNFSDLFEKEYAARVVDLINKSGTTDNIVAIAMRNASDITVNFSRNGIITKGLNIGLVPYLNPSVQGLSKTMRMFSEGKANGTLFNFMFKMTLLTTTPAVMNEILCANNEAYQSLNTRDKDANFLIPMSLFGGDPDTFIKFPKPRENSVLAEPAEYFARFLMDRVEYGKVRKGEYANLSEFKQMFVSAQENVGIINIWEDNLISPIWKTANNETWYGGEIESHSDMYDSNNNLKKPSERFDESTSPVAIWLGKHIGKATENAPNALKDTKFVKGVGTLSPKKIDNLMDSYLGMIYDLGISQYSDKQKTNRRGDPLKSNPVFAQFIKDAVFSNKTATQFWDKVRKTSNEYGEQSQEYKEYMSKYGYDSFTYDDAITHVDAMKGLTDKQKVDMKRELRTMKNQLMERALEGKPIKYDPMQRIINLYNRYGVEDATDKALSTFAYGDHLEAYEHLKSSKAYRDASPEEQKKWQQRFLNVYKDVKSIQRKTGGSDSYVDYSTAVFACVKNGYDKGHIANMYCWKQKDYSVEDQIERTKNYLDAGYTEKNFVATQRAINAGAAKLKKYPSELNDYDKAMILAEKGYRDGAYYITSKYLDKRMNAARCLTDGYPQGKWTDKKINKFCEEYNIKYEKGYIWDLEQVTNAINDKYKNKSDEEKAAIFTVITGNTSENPFGEIGDYRLDKDAGLFGDDDGKGKGGRGRRGRRRGRGGGSGGGKGKDWYTWLDEQGLGLGKKSASISARSTKITDNTSKSALDEAYRKKLRKNIKSTSK